MPTHKTKNIVIKKEDVDVNIIPLVKLLNSLDTTITVYSCEGTPNKQGKLDFCEVMFRCYSARELKKIVEFADDYAKVSIWNKADILDGKSELVYLFNIQWLEDRKYLTKQAETILKKGKW